MEHAAILARNGRIRIDLPSGGLMRAAGGRADTALLLTDDERRDRDRANIVAALQSCGGKVFGPGGAAELLNVRPTTLSSRIKVLGIEVKRARRT
jgi:formate hydrogenlyase transcriptional activator